MDGLQIRGPANVHGAQIIDIRGFKDTVVYNTLGGQRHVGVLLINFHLDARRERKTLNFR